MPQTPVADILEKLPVFGDCTPDERSRLGAYFSAGFWPEGAVLFKEGEAAHELIFVEVGAIAIQRRARSGQVKEIARISGHNALGESAFVDNGVRSTTAVALTDVRGIRMDQSDLDRLCASDAALGNLLLRRLNRLLALKLRKTSREFVEII